MLNEREALRAVITSPLPWGESPYDGKTPREVVDDYALVRGDLVAEYAREQLARWIERYAAHYAAEHSRWQRFKRWARRG